MAATEYFNAGAAGWDGDNLTVKRNNEWRAVRDWAVCDFAENLTRV